MKKIVFLEIHNLNKLTKKNFLKKNENLNSKKRRLAFCLNEKFQNFGPTLNFFLIFISTLSFVTKNLYLNIIMAAEVWILLA